MKGPSGRVRFDVRREWLCPACQRRERTGGQEVTRRCPICMAGDPPRPVWMHLVEPAPKVAEKPA